MSEPATEFSPPLLDSFTGYFCCMRGKDAEELIAANKNAYLLIAVIAHRANWTKGFNRHGLGYLEAFIGDHRNYGMSEREYRTAKAYLEKHGFATFRATNKGTIAKLADSRLFAFIVPVSDEQKGERKTDRESGDGRTSDGRVTTNGDQKIVKNSKSESVRTGGEGAALTRQKGETPKSLDDLRAQATAIEERGKKLLPHRGYCWVDESLKKRFQELRREIRKFER